MTGVAVPTWSVAAGKVVPMPSAVPLVKRKFDETLASEAGSTARSTASMVSPAIIAPMTPLVGMEKVVPLRARPEPAANNVSLSAPATKALPFHLRTEPVVAAAMLVPVPPRAGERVPVAMLAALRLERSAPLPANVLEALVSERMEE